MKYLQSTLYSKTNWIILEKYPFLTITVTQNYSLQSIYVKYMQSQYNILKI